MGSTFHSSVEMSLILLGIPSGLYFLLVRKYDPEAKEQLGETIGNYGPFTTLFSIFLSMTLVSLLVSFTEVQDKTRKEAESLIEAARLASGLTEARALKQSLVDYARAVVAHDVRALRAGEMSPEAADAFDALWMQAYRVNILNKNDENIHRVLLGELETIGNCRFSRQVRAKENIHPMIFFLIVVGYYGMLIKTYYTRIRDRKIQGIYEVSMFLFFIMVITAILDLNTPFMGIINVDTSVFNWALERTLLITSPEPL